MRGVCASVVEGRKICRVSFFVNEARAKPKCRGRKRKHERFPASLATSNQIDYCERFDEYYTNLGISKINEESTA
jgi:hypothetical protein